MSKGPDFEESDDDTPENTHTQRVLANYYMSTEGTLPPWLPPPVQPATKSTAASSNGSSTSGSRSASNPVSLKDIYETAGPIRSQSRARTQDYYSQDQSSYARPPAGGDRLRQKIRPSNTRPTAQARGMGDDVNAYNEYNRGGGRSRGEEDYDPFNYQREMAAEPRQRQYSAGLPSRPKNRI